MTSLTSIGGSFIHPVALRLIKNTNQAVVLQRNGLIMGLELGSLLPTRIGAVPGISSNFDVTEDGKAAVVVGPRLGIWQAGLNNAVPTRLISRRLLSRALYVDNATHTVYVVENRTPGRAYTLSVQPLQIRLFAKGLQAASAAVLEEATGKLLIAEEVLGGRIMALTHGNLPIPLVSGVGRAVDLAWRDTTQQELIVADAEGRRILQVTPSQPNNPPRILFDGIDDLWGVRPLDIDRFLIGAGNSLWLGELRPTILEPVQFDIPVEPLFVGGWTRAGIIVHDPSIRFDDLKFSVEPPESAALVSNSRDNSFDLGNPNVIITAGWMTGEHKVVALHIPTGNVVGTASFEVTDTWLDLKQGPSLAAFGAIEAGPTGSTWGGGDFTTPQNNNVVPALGTRNVAVVLVDTSDARYPTGAALTNIINDFRAEMVNGVMVNGQLRSVAQYFDQASNGRFGINLVDVVGPVQLPNNWATYFSGTNRDDDGDGVVDWVQWSPVNSFSATVIAQIVQRNQNAAGAGNPAFLDLTRVDSLIIVTRSVPATPANAARFVWPRADLGSVTHIIGQQNIGIISIPLFRGIASVYMPDDWTTQPRSGRRWHETVSHELGHNLQLNDQYFVKGTHSTAFQQRIAADNPNQSWEVMAWEEDLPLPSAAHRLMLGWINPSWVKLFNFGVFGPVDETIVLHAASAGAPPAGRYAAAEVRIADGRNYYFEYRPRTAGRIVDVNPPAASTVFGSDVTSRGSTPANRPEILRLRNDSDLDRGEFQTADDYEEVDTTSPQFPNDFLVNILSTTADSATIRVRYGLDQEPDPAITPWSASSNWKSPDIEVINGRSLADPIFHNIPWEGHDNTVIARVTNRGQIPAQGVHMRFSWKDFTFAGGAEASLGDQILDVNNGSTVTFTAPQLWRPPQLSVSVPFFPTLQYQQHACVVARIDAYINGTIVEVTPDNNEAQSNYTWTATTTSSPSFRQAKVLMAENPLPVGAYISFEVHQPHPLFRVYLSQRWAYLEPGAQRPILVMIESLLGDAAYAALAEEFYNQDLRTMTHLRLTALGDTGEACSPVVLGGASILVLAGRTTEFEEFATDGNVAQGLIVAVDTREGVNGRILISIRPSNPDDERVEVLKEVNAENGRFIAEIQASPDSIIQAHYLGDRQFGPSDSHEELV